MNTSAGIMIMRSARETVMQPKFFVL
jgi:hypothetical protein